MTRTWLSLLVLGAWLYAPAADCDLYLGIGAGIRHTDGLALQLAAPIYAGIEGHYSA